MYLCEDGGKENRNAQLVQVQCSKLKRTEFSPVVLQCYWWRGDGSLVLFMMPVTVG